MVGVNLLPPGVNRITLASETRPFIDSGRLTAPPPMCPDCGRPLPADGGPCSFCTLTALEGAAPAPEAAAGLVAGRYLLQRRLGRGGAKDVWLAHDLTLDRGVALARVSGPGAWERLRREARLTARLGGHRHIVTVHDVFDDEGTPCLVARYMTGGSLSDRLEHAPGGRLPPQDAIRTGARSPRRSRMRTRTGSCTATSSPTTCGSTPKARLRSATSASRLPTASPARRRHPALRRARAAHRRPGDATD